MELFVHVPQWETKNEKCKRFDDDLQMGSGIFIYSFKILTLVIGTFEFEFKSSLSSIHSP